MNDANYRKHNDRTHNSSTYHKKDGTPVRSILKREVEDEISSFLDYHDNDLTPAQAEALDRAAARPPVKIKCRDLPSRKTIDEARGYFFIFFGCQTLIWTL